MASQLSSYQKETKPASKYGPSHVQSSKNRRGGPWERHKCQGRNTQTEQECGDGGCRPLGLSAGGPTIESRPGEFEYLPQRLPRMDVFSLSTPKATWAPQGGSFLSCWEAESPAPPDLGQATPWLAAPRCFLRGSRRPAEGRRHASPLGPLDNTPGVLRARAPSQPGTLGLLLPSPSPSNLPSAPSQPLPSENKGTSEGRCPSFLQAKSPPCGPAPLPLHAGCLFLLPVPARPLRSTARRERAREGSAG